MIHGTVRRIGGSQATGAYVGLARIVVREGALLELADESGRVGFGEASPLPGLHTVTVDEVSAKLEEVATLLEEVDALSIEAIRRAASQVAAPPVARFAIETALLHLLAGAGGVVPTGLAELFGAPLDAVPIAGFCGPLRGPEAIARARALAARGIATLKLKTDGADLAAERAVLDALRASLDAPVSLRLDLNGALDADGARAALEAYAAAGVSLVEEPCAGAALASLRDPAMPFFADESLVDPEVASQLLEHPGCAGFVVKPALHGFFGARDLALSAMERGKDVVVTHTFDGPVALAAACELALSLPRAPLACGLDLHDGLDAYASLAVPQHRGASLRSFFAERVAMSGAA